MAFRTLIRGVRMHMPTGRTATISDKKAVLRGLHATVAERLKSGEHYRDAIDSIHSITLTAFRGGAR